MTFVIFSHAGESDHKGSAPTKLQLKAARKLAMQALPTERTSPGDVPPFTPSCEHGVTQRATATGYDIQDFYTEVGYFVVVKSNCDGTLTVHAEEHGIHTSEEDGATNRVYFGDQGIFPNLELCRANDGVETPPLPHNPWYEDPYWASHENFSAYDLYCKDGSGGDPYVRIAAHTTKQVTYLRWNDDASPNPGGVVFYVLFTPD
jgi:hypothetical protein